LTPYNGLPRHSAPISQGSSGGPLFNQFGEVIGVTTAIITQGQNINLAVPANYLRPMLARLGELRLVDREVVPADRATERGADDEMDLSDSAAAQRRFVL